MIAKNEHTYSHRDGQRHCTIRKYCHTDNNDNDVNDNDVDDNDDEDDEEKCNCFLIHFLSR